ncbi:MAG: hypothetical protein WBA74_21805, partial [Cyclobacteriaceae bacterium]
MKTTMYILTVLSLVIVSKVKSQIVATGDLQSRITDQINALPGEGNNNFSTPTAEEFEIWGNGLSQLLDGEYGTAANTFATIDYDVIEFTDEGNNRLYYLLENNQTNYWGTYVFYPDYVSKMIVQSPHPIKDHNTGKQGAYIFENTDAMFFFLAGTHRCNKMETVDCTGKTDACGPDGKFKSSDMAHNDTTVFQSTTDTLFRRYSQSYFLQLHGFTKTDDDPYVILSNGSKEIPETDFIGVLKQKLYDQDNTLTFEVAHENDNWDRLIGRTNTQGRLINGSANACEDFATTNSGRFIHMEQEKTKLRSNQEGWEIVANAVNATLN